MRGTFRELANAGEIPEPHTPLIEPRLSSPLTPRWRKADSNPRSRSYESGCLVSPNQNDQLGARIKLRSSRETAMAACPLGGRSVHGGTDGSNPLSSSGESRANSGSRDYRE